MAYVDCQTDDARLVLENVLDAEASGATVANHLRVESTLRDRRGRVIGVRLVDAETGDRFETRARVVLSATGPFTDSFVADGSHRLRPTLGVHLVFDAARVPHQGRALVLRSPRDNRLFFVLPAGARTIVGTTDTDWTSAQPPRLDDDIRARGEDVAYLLEAANHAFPSLRLGADDVVVDVRGPAAAARDQRAHAVRDVARARDRARRRRPAGDRGRQADDAAPHGRASRRLLSIAALHAGGLERTLARCTTSHRPLPGGAAPPASLAEAGLAPDVTAHLATTYGGRAGEVLHLAFFSREHAARIDPELPYIWAEVAFAVRAEHARAIADVLRRRIPLFRDARDQGLAAAERVAGDPGRRARLDTGAPRSARCSTTAPPSNVRGAGARSSPRRSQNRDHAVDGPQPGEQHQHGLRGGARNLQAVAHVLTVRRREPFVGAFPQRRRQPRRRRREHRLPDRLVVARDHRHREILRKGVVRLEQLDRAPARLGAVLAGHGHWLS